MLKFAILFGFLLAATIANAVPITSLLFWSDMNNQGRRMTCPFLDYDVCYRLPDEYVNLGLSSASFENGNIMVNKIAVTLYSGVGCNTYMNRWGFTRNSWEEPYKISSFPTLNDNVRSFKIAARDLPTTHGVARSDQENWSWASCKYL